MLDDNIVVKTTSAVQNVVYNKLVKISCVATFAIVTIGLWCQEQVDKCCVGLQCVVSTSFRRNLLSHAAISDELGNIRNGGK